MDRYIDVIGDGEIVETAAKFIAQLTLIVRAAKDETALRELSMLYAEAVAILRDSGIGE